MSYSIKQQFIKYNVGGDLSPQGLVLHETADPGATAQNEHDYFNGGDRQASAHGFIDWNEIIQTVDWHKVSWHAGPTANHSRIGIELCRPASHDSAKFQEIWNRGVWLFAYLLINVIGTKTVTKQNLMSHAEVSATWHETDHTDPVSYFSEYGKTVDQFRSEVQLQINSMTAAAPQPAGPIYRIRKSWEDIKSQIGAYRSLDSAKQICDQNSGYHVYDENGKEIYPVSTPAPNTQQHLYRVRLSWEDVKSQVGAFSVLDNAKAECDKHQGYSVFDESGNKVYSCKAADPQPNPGTPTPIPTPTPEPAPKAGHPIMGQEDLKAEQMEKFVHDTNPDAVQLAKVFLEEGAAEGVRGDIAFCQSIKETGYFKFDGDVKSNQNNFAGIGAVGGGAQGAAFPDARTGIRAQIQHLKAYASKEALKQACVDPRYSLVTKGIAPNWEDLNGRWAVPGDGYGESILAIYEKVKVVTVEVQPTPDPVPDPKVPDSPSDDKTEEKNIIMKVIQLLLDLLKKLF